MRHFSKYLATVITLSFAMGLHGAVPASAQVGSPPATAGGQFPATGPEAAFEALHQGRNAEALRLFIDILSLNPGNSDALVGAGLAALRAGDLEGALFYLGKASTLYPSYSDALYGLALAKERTGDIGGAGKAIAAAVKLDPTRED
ncbi:MAG: tetratricopeptide repeat protein, partial [Rectinemataceae bacterium]